MKRQAYSKEHFVNKPIYKELNKIRKEIKETDDPDKKLLLQGYEKDIQALSVELIERVKAKEEGAFEDLMRIKDMRNFLHWYTYHIREYHKFRYGKQNVLHEVRFQIFYHVANNYRIYHEPHEIGLLITSMRNWIKQKVSHALKNTYNPKDDEKLEQVFLEGYESVDTEVYIRDLMDRYLDEFEKDVFRLRFFEERGFVEIGEALGTSKDTVHRKYRKVLGKFKKILSEDL